MQISLTRSRYVFSALVILCSIVSTQLSAEDFLVSTPQAYKKALQKVKPGDAIVMANGVWSDFEIVFKAKGTKSALISLRGETAGKVILSGLSNLRLAGEYLKVSGLVFKNGYTPTGEVISFRRSKNDVANHSRVTQVVIDNFSNPEKFEQDKWVVMYGKHNRFDHSNLVGKRNAGVTMAVRLNGEENQQNHHRIDHNYFGPRPVLGSNGGETLRIGTSHFSLTDSFTIIENNYFDRCNGEVEIISNKSGKNVIRNNVFFESRGTLTLRHGNGNLVEGNVFFGNGVDHTGGIRVINSDQIIRNNYMEGLTGYRFGSGLTVMNGVPNSKINRYHQVNNALIENNTLVDVDHFHLAAGSDQERSAAPINSTIRNNLIVNKNGRDGITIFDDISGIEFVGNVVNKGATLSINKGFQHADVSLQRASNGLLYPQDPDLLSKGASKALQPVKKNEVGASWYPKTEPDIAFDSGNTVDVKAGENALFDAIEEASSGDILVLEKGDFYVNKVIKLNKTITIQAANKEQVNVFPGRSTFFDIGDFGSLKLIDLHISGKYAPDSAGNSLIRTSKLPMQRNYRLEIQGCTIEDLDVNHSYHVFDAGSRSFADYISVSNSVLRNITGDVLRLNKETDDLGIYNGEYIRFTKNLLDNVEGAIAKIYRGGTDESTFGPHFFMDGNIVKDVGLGKRNKSQAAIYLHGVQVVEIENNQFSDSKNVIIEHTVGQPNTVVSHNKFINTPAPTVTELVAIGTSTAQLVDNELVKENR
jgi:poly(beta-D-mannuronate) lyase